MSLFEKCFLLKNKWRALPMAVRAMLRRKVTKSRACHFTAMNKPLSAEDISAMEQQLRGCVAEDRKYWRVNDVKCDAIHTARTYEEFADRVAAAHLQPLEKKDYKAKRQPWNQFAGQSKESDD